MAVLRYILKMLHVIEVNNTHVVMCTVYVCAVDLKFYNCHVAAIMLYICDTAAGDTDSLETFLL